MGGRMLLKTCGVAEPLTTGSVGVAQLSWLRLCAGRAIIHLVA
jgi:hypothetical protein